MKKLLFISGFLLTILLFPKSVFAYVTIENNYSNRINPNSYNITNVNSDWNLSSGSYSSYRDPWLYSPSQFWYAGGVKGTYINVVADYYVGFKEEPYSDATLNSFLNGPQNTLTSTNLRCGIGDYKNGYDSTFIPEVSNFNVTYETASLDSGTQWLYHITFNYKQQIKSVNLNNQNMSCWFVRQPSNGLFAQTIWYTSSDTLRYYYYNSNFQYSVSDDPNTAALNTITEQNTTIINQNTQINDSINDVNDTINNSNVDDPSSSINSFKNNLATNGVITQLVTLPVTLFSNVLNSVNGSCSNYNLGSLFGTDLILPCINISNYIGSSLWSVIDVLISGLFVYGISRKFIKVFDNLSSMKEGDVISD